MFSDKKNFLANVHLVLTKSRIVFYIIENFQEFKWVLAASMGGGGAHPKKTKKKNQSLHQNRQIGIGFFLVFFGFFRFFKNFQIGIGFFCFFWFFFVIGFGQNSKLKTGFFLVFFGFFWLKLWPTFEIRNWFLGFLVFLFFFGFFGFFWDFLGFFGFFGI